MSSLRLFLLVAVVGFVLGTSLAWLNRSAGDRLPEPGSSGASVGDPAPGFRHRNLAGEWVDSAAFLGERALLVNFWATWCAPCRREMPLLQATHLSDDRAPRVVGIALDDPQPVSAFIDEFGITYPILVGREDVMDTQRLWGNSAGVLPFTVLVDIDGVVRWQHYGEVTARELGDALQLLD
ncbi:MAG: TlpA family protein disulfide reductase [Pseudomonadota bacterium]|nr:MAG: TlpA family protein disulfide reductase [Pseudomonadota bacterium]